MISMQFPDNEPALYGLTVVSPRLAAQVPFIWERKNLITSRSYEGNFSNFEQNQIENKSITYKDPLNTVIINGPIMKFNCVQSTL